MYAINEKYLKDYPIPIFFEGAEKILKQMKNSVCQVLTKRGNKGTGFFTKIPIKKNDYIPVFITNNHIIDQDILNNENEIKIKIKNDSTINSIDLRYVFKYTNIEHDVTIIKLKQKEGKSYDFLELDDNILNNDGINYIGNSIYLLHYLNNSEGSKVAVSYGILKDRYERSKLNFIHYCSTDYGSLGAPILNLSNNKIIGIHKQRTREGYKLGGFLYNSIKEFILLYNNRNNSPRPKKIQEVFDFLADEHKYDDDDKYVKIMERIFNQGLISDVLQIRFKNEVIAYKLFSKMFPSNSNDWIPAWHGTKIENLESIIKYGLKFPGTKLLNGNMTPHTTYLPFHGPFELIYNWENAIFATPCLNCASLYSFPRVESFEYSYIPYSPFLVEVRIKPGCFTIHQSKELMNVVGGHAQISVYHDDPIYRISSEKNIFIKSITFVTKKFLNEMNETNIKDYSVKEIIVKPKNILNYLNNLFTY